MTIRVNAHKRSNINIGRFAEKFNADSDSLCALPRPGDDLLDQFALHLMGECIRRALKEGDRTPCGCAN